MKIPLMLSFKEMWRNRGRFILVSLVIALITLLVLFVAAAGRRAGQRQPRIPLLEKRGARPAEHNGRDHAFMQRLLL
jgi:hypothetical protein